MAAASPLPWAFPGVGSTAASPPPPKMLHVTGSSKSYLASDIYNAVLVPDWFPERHPRAPAAVLAGTGPLPACGYCHLPDGSGRVENADLRGLPVSYIEEQVHALASGARHSADPAYGPARYMAATARAIAPADLHAAALYFSALEPVSRTRVVEATMAPRATAWNFVYRFDAHVKEPIGMRILEGPDDPGAYELRDPRAAATAWVPPGSIARGAALARNGAPGVAACESCHTANLLGIGGASPTFIARQLAGFRAGTRNDADAAPMQAISKNLSDAQIIDAAAYVGAHRPWTRAQMTAAMGQ